MARVAKLHEDEETQVPPVADAGTADSAPAPQAAPTASSASAPAAPPPAAQLNPHSRFQDIGRLLYANQGQGRALANQAIRAVGGAATSAQNQLQGAQTAYQNQAQAAVPQAVATAPAATQVGANPLVRGARPTTVVNSTPDYAALERNAAATYQGPRSLGETQGVDQAGLQRAFTEADRAASTLSQPTGVSALLGRSGTGGIGAFDDLLAQHEGGAALHTAGRRFGGLRDQLAAALRDTAPGDAARAATESAAASAQGALADRERGIQERMDRETRAANDAAELDAARQYMRDFYNNPAFRHGITTGESIDEYLANPEHAQDLLNFYRTNNPRQG